MVVDEVRARRFLALREGGQLCCVSCCRDDATTAVVVSLGGQDREVLMCRRHAEQRRSPSRPAVAGLSGSASA